LQTKTYIITAIIFLLHIIVSITIGLLTIVEYVENDAIKNELVAMHIDYLQGYGIAHPEPL